MKLAAEPGEDAQAQELEAVAVYTQTFNKMGFIEPEERDEIYMALRGIPVSYTHLQSYQH